MTGDTVGKLSAEYRKKRVKRIKRIIITLFLILLLLPTVLSVYLIFRVNSLQRQLDRIDEPVTAAATGTAVEADEKPVSGPGSKTEVKTDSEPEEENNEAKVYLTFDDGPGTNTKKILDILNKEDVKATFFVTGKTDDYSKEIYKRIVKEGHTLGMHSYSHVYDEIYASREAFEKDLDKLYDYLHEVTGEYSKYYRFPGGSSVQDTKVPIGELIDVLEDKKITYLDWNVLSPDIRDSGVSKKQMVDEILEDVKKYETSVVMFYDTRTQPMTVKALSSVIKKLKKNGFEILPVDENTAPIRHNQ